ncbi:MAG: N,N-dimethylformamidase beta subunit family domain-containing protein [Pseudomonadota bacterium]
MKSLLGYTDRLTVRPTDSISFRFSSLLEHEVSAHMVRLINGDTHSEQGAFKEERITSVIEGTYTANRHPVYPGSCIFVPGEAFESNHSELSIALRCKPYQVTGRRQVLLSRYDSSANAGWSLYLTEQGTFGFESITPSGTKNGIESNLLAREERWYQLLFSLSAESGRASLWCIELDSNQPFAHKSRDSQSTSSSTERLPGVTSPLTIGGRHCGVDASGGYVANSIFCGRLENPAIAAVALSDADANMLANGKDLAIAKNKWLARWDFSLEQASDRIIDTSLHERHGKTHNLPLRAVRSSVWTGENLRWTDAPEEYSAIHFHEDDLYDCAWPDEIIWEVPDTLRSGVYALKLTSDSDEEYIPFFVASPKQKPQAKVAFMVPTYTYLAYGNNNIFQIVREAYGVSKEASHGFMNSPGSMTYDDLISDNGILGRSTYDSHPDGSGSHFSSWLRPLLNMRPKSILWTFCADLLFIDWLESRGIDYDIITDDLTDQEGVELLQQYAVVMSGNHPEYPTTRILDAIKAYMESGGRFMYMGGNGFYWRSAVSPTYPGAIEVRRGRSGTRPWTSEVGEQYHQFSGELGGQWREIGRPPQQLFGVGFIAQGYGPSYYRVMEGVRESSAAFILDGVDEETFGDYGILGGAAGEEIDQANAAYGTPDHAIVVARSEQHGPGMMYVIDEMSATQPLELYQGQTYADIVFFEMSGGGAVFSTGSMAWCGSLSHNEGVNAVSKITENVISRFVDPTPFDGPA